MVMAGVLGRAAGSTLEKNGGRGFARRSIPYTTVAIERTP
jgi:hypothetical protein